MTTAEHLTSLQKVEAHATKVLEDVRRELARTKDDNERKRLVVLVESWRAVMLAANSGATQVGAMVGEEGKKAG